MNTYRSEAEVSENACSEYEVRVAEAATTIGRPCEAGAPTEPAGETVSSFLNTQKSFHRKKELYYMYKHAKFVQFSKLRK